MTVTGFDSISKGQVSPISKRLQSVGSKIHRGFTVCATGTPSIPSRYLTIISSNSEKEGFRQTAKRFQSDSSSTPGPGHYETLQSLDKQLERTSDSKKGTGSFASKSKRSDSMHLLSNVPAPTSYNTAVVFGHEHQDFNRSKYSSMFQKPIAEGVLSPKCYIPPPNQYDIDHGFKTITKANNVTAQAAFRSHTRRSAVHDKHFATPAPGTYDVDDSFVKSLAPVLQSSFKSTSKRETFNVQGASQLPGPADYRPFDKILEEPHRQILPRHHYLTISAPALPQAPEEPTPGPGAYELRHFSEKEKKYMSSAVFVSSTSRWAVDPTATAEEPGPASYTPRVPLKQSFNFNFERKWIS